MRNFGNRLKRRDLCEIQRTAVETVFSKMSARLSVLHGYRAILRTATRVFRNDATALDAGRRELRTQFENGRAETDPAKIGGFCEVVTRSDLCV